MSIELSERTLGIWQVDLPGGNWMAHVGANAHGQLELVYRFRWYRDDKVHDSEDLKNWYRVTPKPHVPDPAAHLIKVARYAFQKLTEGNNPAGRPMPGWELIRGERTLDEFMTALEAMPGVHSQTLSLAEAEAQGILSKACPNCGYLGCVCDDDSVEAGV